MSRMEFDYENYLTANEGNDVMSYEEFEYDINFKLNNGKVAKPKIQFMYEIYVRRNKEPETLSIEEYEYEMVYLKINAGKEGLMSFEEWEYDIYVKANKGKKLKTMAEYNYEMYLLRNKGKPVKS
jgi:hypothetical protein